jgi:MFS family permease
VGDTEGARALAAAVVCLIAAPLIAVLGYRRLMVVAAVLLGVARLGQAGMPQVAVLMAFGAMYGCGDGMFASSAVAFLAENSTPVERSHLFTADLFVNVAGSMIGGLLGGFLPTWIGAAASEADALRLTVLIAGLLILASSLPLMMMREKLARPGHAFRHYLDTLKGFRSWGHVGRLVVPQLLIPAGAGLIIPFLSLYLKQQLGASIGQVGLIQGLAQLSMGLAALGAPYFAKRFGLVKTTVMAEAASLPFLAAIPFITSLPVAAVVFWLRAAFMNMSWPAWNQYTMEHVPGRERSIVAGILAFAWSVSWLAGSALGGRLMAYSYTVPYMITTALYAAGTLSTWLLLRKHEEPPAWLEAT